MIYLYIRKINEREMVIEQVPIYWRNSVQKKLDDEAIKQ